MTSGKFVIGVSTGRNEDKVLLRTDNAAEKNCLERIYMWQLSEGWETLSRVRVVVPADHTTRISDRCSSVLGVT